MAYVNTGVSTECSLARKLANGIADAYRDDGQRFVVHANDKLPAFLELETALCIHPLSE